VETCTGVRRTELFEELQEGKRGMRSIETQAEMKKKKTGASKGSIPVNRAPSPREKKGKKNYKKEKAERKRVAPV